MRWIRDGLNGRRPVRVRVPRKKQATPEENAESLPLRKEEKSERKPSGFPFAFHRPPAGDGPPRGPNAKKGQQHNSVLLPFLVETGGLGSAG
jgi:hypothetical protein